MEDELFILFLKPSHISLYAANLIFLCSFEKTHEISPCFTFETTDWISVNFDGTGLH
jgi:hypothetical protein